MTTSTAETPARYDVALHVAVILGMATLLARLQALGQLQMPRGLQIQARQLRPLVSGERLMDLPRRGRGKPPSWPR